MAEALLPPRRMERLPAELDRIASEAERGGAVSTTRFAPAAHTVGAAGVAIQPRRAYMMTVTPSKQISAPARS